MQNAPQVIDLNILRLNFNKSNRENETAFEEVCNALLQRDQENRDLKIKVHELEKKIEASNPVEEKAKEK